jgi:hypothetical protein
VARAFSHPLRSPSLSPRPARQDERPPPLQVRVRRHLDLRHPLVLRPGHRQGPHVLGHDALLGGERGAHEGDGGARQGAVGEEREWGEEGVGASLCLPLHTAAAPFLPSLLPPLLQVAALMDEDLREGRARGGRGGASPDGMDSFATTKVGPRVVEQGGREAPNGWQRTTPRSRLCAPCIPPCVSPRCCRPSRPSPSRRLRLTRVCAHSSQRLPSSRPC